MTPIPHTLAAVVFRNLPQATAKEAQASWRLAEVIAAGITEELNRQARVNTACVKCEQCYVQSSAKGNQALTGENRQMTIENQIEDIVSGQSVAKLQEMATLLADDFQEGADYVFAAVLRALESAMSEADFLAFCETI